MKTSMQSKPSIVAMLSHPKVVLDVIRTAAAAVQKSAPLPKMKICRSTSPHSTSIRMSRCALPSPISSAKLPASTCW